MYRYLYIIIIIIIIIVIVVIITTITKAGVEATTAKLAELNAEDKQLEQEIV